jgi:hypothetical protein
MDQGLVYDRDGYYQPNTSVSDEIKEEIRSVLQRLDVRDRIQYAIPTQKNVPSEVRVVGITARADDEGTRRELHLRGPEGGKYHITDHPEDKCRHAISESDHGRGPQGPVVGVRLLGGDVSAL